MATTTCNCEMCRTSRSPRVKSLRDYWRGQTDAMIDRRNFELARKQKAMGWEENKHPRHPKGSEDAGQFRSKNEAAESTRTPPAEEETDATTKPNKHLWSVQVNGVGGKWQDYYSGTEQGAYQAAYRALKSGLKARLKGPDDAGWQTMEED